MKLIFFTILIILSFNKANSQIKVSPFGLGGLSSLLENGEILYDNKVGFSNSDFQVWGITYQRKIDSNWRVGIGFHINFQTSTDLGEISFLDRTYQTQSTDRNLLYNISLQLHRFIIKNKKNNIYIFANLGYGIHKDYYETSSSELAGYGSKHEWASYKEFNTGTGLGLSYQIIKNVSLDLEIGIAYNFKKGFDEIVFINDKLNNIKYDINKVRFGAGVGLYFCF